MGRRKDKAFNSRTKGMRFRNNKSSSALMQFITPLKQIPGKHWIKLLNTERHFGVTEL